jgi:oxazoline/thiazoline dehydrogenase
MELLSIRNGTTLNNDEGLLTVSSQRLRLTLGNASPGIRSAIGLLFERSASEDELMERAIAVDGFMAGPYMMRMLHRMESSGVICRTIGDPASPIATMVPLGPRMAQRDATLDVHTRYRLSRFAALRCDDGALLLESPQAPCRFILHDPEAAASVLAFGPGLLGADAPNRDRFTPLLDALVKTEFLQQEEADDRFRTWEVHDLTFHARSRLGRHDHPYGGTYRYEGLIDPLPAVKPPMAGETIALPAPDLDALMRNDPPLAAVMEQRRSIRIHGEDPLTAAQLGELLYRTTRVRRVFGEKDRELSSRPYPGGGAIYALETYPVVDRCEGVPSGLYHYCPQRHVLTRVAGDTPAVRQLLENAYRTINGESRPQVVLTFTARFGRVAQKYESMAYALILKDVGVLYQSLYLAATAMGLAPCALGGGDSELFAAASGLEWFVEGAVGEFAIGTKGDAR